MFTVASGRDMTILPNEKLKILIVHLIAKYLDISINQFQLRRFVVIQSLIFKITIFLSEFKIDLWVANSS
jgi:hypothetical protein